MNDTVRIKHGTKMVVDARFGINWLWLHEEQIETSQRDMVMLHKSEAMDLIVETLRRWPDVREEVLRRIDGNEQEGG